MFRHIVRRVLQTIPMLLLLSILVFWGLRLMPGNAVEYMIGPDAIASMNPKHLAEMEHALGLDQPFYIQYVNWLWDTIRGNLGVSLTSGQPVAAILAPRLAATGELAIAALIFSTILGTAIGVASALRKNSLMDQSLTVLGMIALSVPEFFLGLVLILIFALFLGWFPVGGRLSISDPTFLGSLEHLILPMLALGGTMTAGVMRYARSSMLDAETKPFMLTAWAKGASPARAYFWHGFRTTLTPLIVLVGFRLPTLISGVVVIETVFQWPGIGSEFLEAVQGHDYPVVMMIALLSTAAMLVASIIIDVLTAVIDPRVRLN